MEIPYYNVKNNIRGVKLKPHIASYRLDGRASKCMKVCSPTVIRRRLGNEIVHDLLYKNSRK
jgi:hypothetical protein